MAPPTSPDKAGRLDLGSVDVPRMGVIERRLPEKGQINCIAEPVFVWLVI